MSIELPCPVCREQQRHSVISIEPQLLLSGAQFSCPVCHSAISLSAESHAVYQKGLADYRHYQSTTLGLKQQGNKPGINHR